jgi:hypothetical protein
MSSSPNEKVFRLFLEFETRLQTKINDGNITYAIQYVLQNYHDPDIPTRPELDRLALQYIKIPAGNRTRTVLTGPLGRALSNPSKQLTEVEKKQMQEAIKQKKEKTKQMLEQATNVRKIKEELELQERRKIGEEREAQRKEECRIEGLYAAAGYDRPAQRPNEFITGPSDHNLTGHCILCWQPLSMPVAFCRYCHQSIHLACYNEMTPTERVSLFVREGFSGYATTGVCNICHNGLTDLQLDRMELRGGMDDPTYYRWPRNVLLEPSSSSSRVDDARAIIADQGRAYSQALEMDAHLIERATAERQLQQVLCDANPGVCRPYSCTDPTPEHNPMQTKGYTVRGSPPPPPTPPATLVGDDTIRRNIYIMIKQNSINLVNLDDIEILELYKMYSTTYPRFPVEFNIFENIITEMQEYNRGQNAAAAAQTAAAQAATSLAAAASAASAARRNADAKRLDRFIGMMRDGSFTDTNNRDSMVREYNLRYSDDNINDRILANLMFQYHQNLNFMGGGKIIHKKKCSSKSKPKSKKRSSKSKSKSKSKKRSKSNKRSKSMKRK